MRALTAAGVASQSASEIPAGGVVITGGLCLRCNRDSSRRQGFSRAEVRGELSRPLNGYRDLHHSRGRERKEHAAVLPCYTTYVQDALMNRPHLSPYAFPHFLPTAKDHLGHIAFIGHLRIGLTLLVILQHLIVGYGGAYGKWYYHNMRVVEGAQWTLLTAVWIINQAFFMGFFFLVSAYFIPGSCRKKGCMAFAANRLLRLGFPLIVYILFVNPVLMYVAWTSKGAFNGSLFEFLVTYLNDYTGLDVGVVWFLELLLIFVGGYILFMFVLKAIAALAYTCRITLRTPSCVCFSSVPADLYGFAVAVVLSLFVLFERLNLSNYVSYTTWTRHLGLPQYHITQYALLFVLGLFFANRNMHLIINRLSLSLWRRMTFALLILLPLVLRYTQFSKAYVAPYIEKYALHKGAVIVFAIWEQFFCISFILFLICWSYKHLNEPSNLARNLDRVSYSSYLVHAPLITLLMALLNSLTLDPLSKFMVAMITGIPLSFFVGSLLKQTGLGRAIL
jgi:hypothetical protein